MSGNSNELKLRSAERDQTIAENVTLRDELKDCWESKESLKERLGMMEKSMLVIVDQYEVKMVRERQVLATIHGQAEVLALQGERESGCFDSKSLRILEFFIFRWYLHSHVFSTLKISF